MFEGRQYRGRFSTVQLEKVLMNQDDKKVGELLSQLSRLKKELFRTAVKLQFKPGVHVGPIACCCCCCM